MGVLVLVIFLATLLSSSHADFNPIKMKGRRSATVGADPTKINCLSFRLGVEAYNLRDWDTIPSYCQIYLESYFTGKQYGLDIQAMVDEARNYMLEMSNAKDNRAWIFDVEDTLLNNKDYFNSSKFQYGTYPLDITSYYEYLKESTGEEVPGMLDFYDEVYSLGYKIFLISDAPESLRTNLEELLSNAGYGSYTSIILRGEGDEEKSAAQFKSEKRSGLVNDGWNIVGNVGDQWSDLSGAFAGGRTFKIPNPWYYVE